MIRTLGGIAAGLAAAIVIMMLTETMGNQIAPPPARIGVSDDTDARALPFLTLLFPVLGWFVGALIGSWLAIRVSDESWTAWVVAGCVLAATIFNFILALHPTWVMVAGLIVPVLGAWLAQRFCAMRSAVSA